MSSISSENQPLTHFNEKGQAHMVDVAGKNDTRRTATAEGTILIGQTAWDRVKTGTAEKGDVIGIARTAAIMGAKRTSDLIPLCHPLPLTHITVDFHLQEEPPAVICRARVETIGKTGVEMEALTAVQTGLLTIYDMLKAIEKGMVIHNVRLLQKTGGKSGDWPPASSTP